MKGHLVAAAVVAGTATLAVGPASGENLASPVQVINVDRSQLTVAVSRDAIETLWIAQGHFSNPAGTASPASVQLSVDITQDGITSRWCKAGAQFPDAILEMVHDRPSLSERMSSYRYAFEGGTVGACTETGAGMHIDVSFLRAILLSTELTLLRQDGTTTSLPVVGISGFSPASSQTGGPGTFSVWVPDSAQSSIGSICTSGEPIPGADIRVQRSTSDSLDPGLEHYLDGNKYWSVKAWCRQDAAARATKIQLHYDSASTGNSKPPGAGGVPLSNVEATATLLDGTVHKFTILRVGGIDLGSPPPQGPGTVNFDVPSNQIASDPSICASGMYGLLFNGIKPSSDVLAAMAAPTQLMGVHVESCRPALSPNATNIQVRYTSVVTVPPASPPAPEQTSRTTDRLRRERELVEFGVPLEFLNVQTGIFGSVTTPGGSTGGSTIPVTTTIPFSSKFRINNDHFAWRFGLDWRKPIDSSSDLGLSFGLNVPFVGTKFTDLTVTTGTCPTCFVPGTQSFAPRIGGTIFVNYGREFDFGCEQPTRLFFGGGFAINNNKFGIDISALNLNFTTEHTDVVPGFQTGVSAPVSVGSTWFDLGLTAGYFLHGSNDKTQVGNTLINNKVGGTAFVEASVSWAISEEWKARLRANP